MPRHYAAAASALQFVDLPAWSEASDRLHEVEVVEAEEAEQAPQPPREPTVLTGHLFADLHNGREHAATA